MSSYGDVGANLADVDLNAIVAAEAGDVASQGGATAMAAAVRLESEVNDVLVALTSSITSMAETVNASLAGAASSAYAADIRGRTGQGVEQITGELQARTATIVDNGLAQVRELDVFLKNQVVRFQSDVIGDLQAVLDLVQADMATLAQRQQVYAASLAEADTTLAIPA